MIKMAVLAFHQNPKVCLGVPMNSIGDNLVRQMQVDWLGSMNHDETAICLITLDLAVCTHYIPKALLR